MELISINDLTKLYSTKEVETIALDNVNLTIAKGEFVAIMGPSGCGKTTLLNIIGLIDTCNSGRYIFSERDITDFKISRKAEFRKSNIGFIFQNFSLINEINVSDNIEIPLIYSGISKKQRILRVREVLEKLQMSHRAKHFPNQLSGGQQQRVAIARAIISNPKLLLADEPTGNLDSKNSNEVMQILKKLNSEGTTILMVTHSIEDAEYSDRIVNLFDGRIVIEKRSI